MVASTPNHDSLFEVKLWFKYSMRPTYFAKILLCFANFALYLFLDNGASLFFNIIHIFQFSFNLIHIIYSLSLFFTNIHFFKNNSSFSSMQIHPYEGTTSLF